MHKLSYENSDQTNSGTREHLRMEQCHFYFWTDHSIYYIDRVSENIPSSIKVAVLGSEGPGIKGDTIV